MPKNLVLVGPTVSDDASQAPSLHTHFLRMAQGDPSALFP